jgi:hypothetical protein
VRPENVEGHETRNRRRTDRFFDRTPGFFYLSIPFIAEGQARKKRSKEGFASLLPVGVLKNPSDPKDSSTLAERATGYQEIR